MTKTKTLQLIEQLTNYIEADDIVKVYLTNTKQIACIYKNDGIKWTGEIQKIYKDKNGEAYAYDVYVY